MRTTEYRARRRPSLATSVVASATALLLLGPGSGAAIADRSDDPFPSRQDVRSARAEAQSAADRVAAIRTELVLANAEVDAAAVRAAQAAEAYNGARWQVEQATAQLEEARADARRAERQVARQRDRMAGLVATSYQEAGQLSAVDAVLGARGPEGLMSQLLAVQGATTSLDTELQSFGATAALADVFREEAEKVRIERLALLDAAEEAKDQAAAAAAEAESLAASVAARKTEVVAELAELEGISVELAQQRQTALEELEQKRKDEAAAQAAAAAAAAEEPAPDLPAEPDPQPQTEPDPEPQPEPPPTPEPHNAPAPSGGAAAAIAFARAQLGEPYVWAAAGPEAWDCSGLTMGAWRAGGASLPHYSVAQYDATTPISAAQLRPGDLVFWSSSSSPSGIFHVALYLGDGMIIHAPRTGRPVSIDSMYYWVPPTHFGRV
ncbi:MAG TPA: C40 family peptidase [Marmoricola sp.]|nr:C40 family peptidase [Marmoricola sp.]